MDVADRVIAILAEQALLQPADVGRHHSLKDLGIDSLALVETIFALEEAFDVQVPFNANDPRADGFDAATVQRVIDIVEGLVRARS